ncbi:hypothetical protein AMJ47_03860 [Parcubacteria bacterium DG_72]|nr:MAG: hypothetical protein AMJ47_03860 [Parcubacteria bacterium DG_72]
MKDVDKKIKEVLSQGVGQILPDQAGLFRLMKKRKIRLYHGIDPTSNKLHLGHTISLRKLQQFADLGHEAILVIGTGTVLTGDPSLRDKARGRISEKEIKANIKTWKAQAAKVLDFSKAKIRYNGDWLLKLNFKQIANIASHISAIKLFQRDMFQKRLKRGDTVWAHEALYPLLQGYDSVYLDVDLEIGGTDQTFNMLIGRELQQKMRKKEKFVMTLLMILGTDGRQMSKSSGNCIWLTDSAEQMFGKIMSIADNLVPSYFKALTSVSLNEIKTLSPRDAKARLAKEIVTMYHSKSAALNAEKEFNQVFKEKKPPSKIPQVLLKEKKLNLLDLLTKTKLAPSRSEAKRLVEQGGVKINGKVQKEWQKIVKLKKKDIVQVGKRKFIKLA